MGFWEPVAERKIGMDDLLVVAELVGMMVSSELVPSELVVMTRQLTVLDVPGIQVQVELEPLADVEWAGRV